MKPQKKKPRRAGLRIGWSLLVGGILVSILCSTTLKDWVIISFGVRQLGVIQLITRLVAVGGGILIGWNGLAFMRIWMAEKQAETQEQAEQQERSRVLQDYVEDNTNPDFTRRRLEQLQLEMPQFEDLVEKCLDQMDRMDRLQAKQQLLIEANDARYLKDTVAVLDKVERRICQNFRVVINLCITADDEPLDMKQINRSLEDNEMKLGDTKELLKASVDWINQYNADGNITDRSEVENWITVIRNSLKEE